MSDSKFAAFLKDKKIHPKRVLSASTKLEALTPEDRAIRLAKRKGRKAEGDNAAKESRKPRTGRPVTERALSAAMTGKPITGPTKTRIVRAVNHLLEQKKQSPVDLRALF